MLIMCTILLICLWKLTNNMEVTILLPEEEAKKWVLFQQYYDTFNLLVDNDVFEQKNGKVILHFDQNSTLQVIERADILYAKRIVDRKA